MHKSLTLLASVPLNSLVSYPSLVGVEIKSSKRKTHFRERLEENVMSGLGTKRLQSKSDTQRCRGRSCAVHEAQCSNSTSDYGPLSTGMAYGCGQRRIPRL